MCCVCVCVVFSSTAAKVKMFSYLYVRVSPSECWHYAKAEKLMCLYLHVAHWQKALVAPGDK